MLKHEKENRKTFDASSELDNSNKNAPSLLIRDNCSFSSEEESISTGMCKHKNAFSSDESMPTLLVRDKCSSSSGDNSKCMPEEKCISKDNFEIQKITLMSRKMKKHPECKLNTSKD